MIDVHCHLNFETFDETRDEIIVNSKDRFSYIIDSGASIESNTKSKELSDKYSDFIKTTMGYHPEYAGVDSKSRINNTLSQITDNIDNIHAIGEIGLDFATKRTEAECKQQHEVFRTLLSMAEEYDMPVVLHVREAEAHALEIIKEYPNIPDVIFHCFSGSKKTALEAVDCGYYISFATNALFSKKHKKNIKAVPLENMLTETDSPYLSPERGQNNQPLNIEMTINRIQRTKKDVDFDEIEKQTEKNAKKVFNL